MAVEQDKDGYLWIGTAAGLTRFDGIHFTPFPFSNEPGTQDEGVNRVVAGRDGGLWLIMRDWTIMHLNPDLSRIEPVGEGLSKSRSLQVFEDKDGSFWIAFADSIWRIKEGLRSRVSGPGLLDKNGRGYASGFVTDNEGRLWLGKGSSVFLLRNGRFETIATTTYRAHLASSRFGGIWVAQGKQLLRCYSDGRVLDCGSFIPADPHSGTSELIEDHTGAVWIGTTSAGLFRYDGSGFEKIETSHPAIACLTEDREGNVWVGTTGGGLDRVSRRGVELETLNAGSMIAPVQCLCEDTNGTLWGATQNGLLVSRVNGQWQPSFPDPPWTNAVDSVAADKDGGVWIGTRNSGLYCWRDGKFAHWGRSDGLSGNIIQRILPLTNGDVWLAEDAAISVQRLSHHAFRTFRAGNSDGRITALAADAAGNIWAGSEMGALLKVQGDRLVNETGHTSISNRSILALFPAQDGALWIGYGGGGLGRLKDGKFARIGRNDGLFDDFIFQMVADDQGWIWFGGERGIFKAPRAELESVFTGRADKIQSISYGRNEGLFSMEANSVSAVPYVMPVAVRSRDGRLWIPMRKALAVVDPKILEFTSTPPQALLTQVIVDGRTVASLGGIAATKNIANLETPNTILRLPPAHRHLQISFTAIHLSAPENVHFRYQLAGFDNDWIDAQENRTAEYSRLTAANYQFRVESSIGDGPWNEKPTTLAFNVAPFFWQRWSFRVAALLLFTSCVIAIVRYISFRRLQAEMRLVEQRAALDKERTRIARDLHDDLGCSLNKVALTLDMTQRTLAGVEAVNGKIEHCSAMVRQAAKSVDEIVWAINPRNDTLRYMVDYISQFAVEFLHAADIPCRVHLPDSVPERHLSPEARHNLFLVVKEALNNVVRHAKAGEVHLHITADENRVAISIEDDGCGFEYEPDNACCDGLRNMRQRMQEISGEFQLASKTGAGTNVAFVYSWTRGNGA